MEDFHVAEFRQVASHEVGLFAIFDGHSGCNVARYLQCNLFDNILNEPGFWEDPVNAIWNAYQSTDETILDEATILGGGGSTAVTVIIIDGVRLLVANIGDSRALLCREGGATQLSVDHDPVQEQDIIKDSMKREEAMSAGKEVMDNQEAVDLVRSFDDLEAAAKALAREAVARGNIDDISAIVVVL